MHRALVAALEVHGRWTVDASDGASRGRCQVLLVSTKRAARAPALPGWSLVASETRPTDRDDVTLVYRRR
jgi:hypothetical protein